MCCGVGTTFMVGLYGVGAAGIDIQGCALCTVVPDKCCIRQVARCGEGHRLVRADLRLSADCNAGLLLGGDIDIVGCGTAVSGTGNAV